MSLFEDQTPEVIRNRILDRLGTTLQTREGSFCHDVAAPVAFELWRILMTMDELVSAFYVDETSGPWLDAHAGLLGLARREGSAAIATVSFDGTDGVEIPRGTLFFTSDGLEYSLKATVVIREGVGTGTLQATSVGGAYNTETGAINQIMHTIPGLSAFTVSAAEGGLDAESDESLFARIQARRTYSATSGNESHYKEWALSCEGVGAARVTPVWDGPGTVRVMIVGYDNQPVDKAVVESCAAYIETQRPVGAQVTVLSAGSTAINVTAVMTLKAGVSLEAVQEAFVSNLDTYLKEIAFSEYLVRYNQIHAILMRVSGVEDFTGLTINGGTVNVAIGEDHVPVMGEVILT